MKTINKIYRTILNFPETEMTVGEIIDSLGDSFNPQTVRVNVCKMAASGIFIEKTGKRRGREMIYKKHRDIQEQWLWMNKNRSARGTLPSPQRPPRPALKTANPAPEEPQNTVAPTQMREPRQPSESPAKAISSLFQNLKQASRYLNKMTAIEESLLRIEKALQSNGVALEQLRNTCETN